MSEVTLKNNIDDVSTGKGSGNPPLTLNRFFTGWLYPVVVGVLVLTGHITSLEVWFAIPNVLLIALALLTVDTARPFIVFACSFVYQVSLKYGPGYPNFSDYYFTGWRLVIVVTLGVILFGSMVIFAVKNKIFQGISLTGTPLLTPLIALSVAFVLNGAFSSSWNVQDLIFGVLQALIYSGLFLFFYFGLRRENGGELCSYFIYVSAIIACVLILETLHLFVTSDGIIVDGKLVKEEVLFGWGIWNTAGVCLATLIPTLFLGVMRGRRPWIYFILATITLLCAALTLSRNAILFGGIAYVICLLLCCFFGKSRMMSFLIVAFGIVGVGLIDVFFSNKLSTLLADILSRGFSDNGRFLLWGEGIERFLLAPVFGSGFFTAVSDTADFFPAMVHQTFIQLLSSMGIVGLLTYLFYRGSTLIPLVKRPTVEKTMLYISIFVMLGESLLDNFVFYFLPVIYYTVTTVLILYLDRE